MPVIAEDVIRSLAGFKAEQAPVTSVYLDVDGRRLLRHQDLEHEVDVLLKGARSRANGDASVAKDLVRVGRLVKDGLDRSSTRGLVIFACSAHDLWEVIALPVPVPSRVVINHVPALSQLEAVLQEAEAIGVLLADRQHARMFVFELGELTELSELSDELPREYDTRGERDQGDVAPHVDALRDQHVRHAAAVAWQVFKERGFEHLALGGPDEMLNSLEGTLHPYLRERLCGRVGVAVTASLDEVRTAAIEMETEVERAQQAADVERLRQAVAVGRRAVAGLGAVLGALNQRRAEQVLVSQGFVEAGWRCDACSTLHVVGRRCGVCGGEMDEVEDVVEEAVEMALANRCRVEICNGNADLDVLGRIGAHLHY